MSKPFAFSLVLLLALDVFAASAVVAPARADKAVICNDDLVCVPVVPPGDPAPDPGHDGPGSPGDPYIPPDLTTADIVKNMLIACRISGMPEDLPNDLKFRNIGDITIPAGTRVYWMVSETKRYGYFVVPRDLPVGESVSDLDVLPKGLPTSDHCHSKII